MSLSSSRIELFVRKLTQAVLAFAAATTVVMVAPNESLAQVDVKKAIVKVVSVGTRQLGNGRIHQEKGYVGSGFIVYTADEAGGAQTVIATADHVLGYSVTKAASPGMTFSTDVQDQPPVWVKKGHEACRPELKIENDGPGAEEPCRQIDTYFINERGRWEPHGTTVHVHRDGYRNQDFAVLWVRYFHPNLTALEIGNTYSLNSAALRKGSALLPPLQAWGVEARRADDDPFSTQLTYRSRDEGPTLLFQTAVKSGNSGGPILFEGKVIGIVSAVQGDETRGTRIQTVYDALRNWDIKSVQAETAATISNARKALFNNDFGTAHRLLTEMWMRPDRPEETPTARRSEKLQAARLLAKLNVEKLDNSEAAVDWLTKLTKLDDRRAQVELALLPLASKEVGNSDLRALQEPDANAPNFQANAGYALARLISNAATAEEAMLACIYYDMDDEDKEPSCSSLSATSRLIRRALFLTLPPDKRGNLTNDEIKVALEQSPLGKLLSYSETEIDQIEQFKNKGHVLLPLVAGRNRKLYPSSLGGVWMSARSALSSAALAGSIPAALQFLSSTSIPSDVAKKIFSKVAGIVEAAQYVDDNIYVVSEDFFRIVDNRPTRQDFIHAKALVALAHILGKTDAPEKEQAQRAALLIEEIDRRLLGEERLDGGRHISPHRLIFLVKALVSERAGENTKAAQFIRRALPEWDKVRYLPSFAIDLDVFAQAVRITAKGDALTLEPWLVTHVREACRDNPRCWPALFDQFSTLTQKLSPNSVEALADLFVERIGGDAGLVGLDGLDPDRLRKVATMATLLHEHFKGREPPYKKLGALVEIKDRLDRRITDAPCPETRCEVRAWKAIAGVGNLQDWQLSEGRTNWGTKSACRMTTNKGLLRRMPGRDAKLPQLTYLTFGIELSKRTLEFEPGVKVSQQSASGERTNLFVLGDQQFAASVRDDGGKSFLFMDGNNPELPRLLAAMSSDNSLTVSYRKEGDQQINREHMSLQGFDAAYTALQKRCLTPTAGK